MFRNVYLLCFHERGPATAKLEPNESAMNILQPQKFSFELLEVLKKGFTSRKNVPQRDILNRVLHYFLDDICHVAKRVSQYIC